MHIIEEILIEFQAEDITASAIERSLELKQGALQIAIMTDDPEVVALLKMVRTYPWLLEVAEHNFREDNALRILLHNAVNVMVNEKYNNTNK